MAERLQKFLAKSGIGSRRFCETLIKSKRIKINGVIAEIGASVTKNDFIEFDGKEIQYKESEIKLLILNKPRECSLQIKKKKIYLSSLIFYLRPLQILDGFLLED